MIGESLANLYTKMRSSSRRLTGRRKARERQNKAALDRKLKAVGVRSATRKAVSRKKKPMTVQPPAPFSRPKPVSGVYRTR